METQHSDLKTLKVIARRFPGLKWKEGEPIASVIAAPPNGESISSKARPCLHVFRDSDGQYSFADGVIAIKDSCIVAETDCSWPEMYNALILAPRDFAGLLNTKEGEPPYLRVKNLQEDGYTANRPDDNTDAYAAKALKILSCWNTWMEKSTEWRNRLHDVYGNAFMGKEGAVTDSAADLLRKLCDKIGLKPGQKTEFEKPNSHLLACLNKLDEVNAAYSMPK